MKNWRRTSRVGTSTTGATVAHLLSVVSNGDNSATWTFDTTIVSIADPTNLDCNNYGSGSVTSGLGTPAVIIDYGGPVGSGDPYQLNAAGAGMVFSPTKSIADASGFCT